jgi:hypothetical protein
VRRLSIRHVLKGAATAWTLVVAVALLAVGAAALSISTASTSSQRDLVQLASSVRPPPAPRGWKIVSYDGVYVDVPSEWPVVDGMHTGFCGGPFPDTPTAFVGPNLNSPPACPATLGPTPALYGVWLYPNRGGPGMGIVTPDQRLVEVEPSYWSESHIEDLWYRGVEIEVGIGPDPQLVQEIVHSIGFKKGVANTRAAGACGMQSDPGAMPTPERLSQPLVLDDGDEVLDPAPASQQPTVSAQRVWEEDPAKWPYERYSLIFALFSAKYPAASSPRGWVPSFHDDLAWVIYSVPITPTQGCGASGLDVYSATSGQDLESVGW